MNPAPMATTPITKIHFDLSLEISQLIIRENPFIFIPSNSLRIRKKDIDREFYQHFEKKFPNKQRPQYSEELIFSAKSFLDNSIQH